MKKLVVAFCLIGTALSFAPIAKASSNCGEEVKKAALEADGREAQGETCEVSRFRRANIPQQTLSIVGSVEVICHSGTTSIELIVSPAPYCAVKVIPAR